VPIHDAMDAESLPAGAPAIWAGCDVVDQRSAAGWALRLFLFAAGIQAAQDALPPRGGACTDGDSMMACSWAKWWKSRECWRPFNKPCRPPWVWK